MESSIIVDDNQGMNKDKMFALLEQSNLLWEGPLIEIKQRAIELTKINLDVRQKFECAKDAYKTLTRIDRFLFLYDSTPVNYLESVIITPEQNSEENLVKGAIYSIKLSYLCNRENQVWSEENSDLTSERERVHEAYYRLTGRKLSITNPDTPEKQVTEEGTYYGFNYLNTNVLEYIVFLSYPGNNFIYKIN